MSYIQVPKFALGIDWETSGYSLPNYAEKHQGISFGAIIFDMQTLASVEEIYCEIKFDSTKYIWNPGAEKVHGITQQQLLSGVSQEEAAVELCNLVVKYIGTEDVILLGHRVHFDKAFTNQLTETIGVNLNYHPTVIDTASLATVLMEMSKSEDVFQTLGLPPRQNHNALEDIRYTLHAVRKMKQYFLAGIVSELSN